MGNYGRVAVTAVNLIHNNNLTPRNAWQQALQQLHINDKPCPKTAFLGLAEAGMIRGVRSGHYLRQSNLPNKQRAIALRNIIFRSYPPRLPIGIKRTIWLRLTGNTLSNDQGVIDVVYTLFRNNLLR